PCYKSHRQICENHWSPGKYERSTSGQTITPIRDSVIKVFFLIDLNIWDTNQREMLLHTLTHFTFSTRTHTHTQPHTHTHTGFLLRQERCCPCPHRAVINHATHWETEGKCFTTSTCIPSQTQVNTHTHTCWQEHMHACVRICTCMHVLAPPFQRTHTHAYTHAYTHTHTQ